MDNCETCKGTYLLDNKGVMVAGDCNCEFPWNYLQEAGE